MTPAAIISLIIRLAIVGLYGAFAFQKFQYTPDAQAIFDGIGGHPAAIATGVFELIAAVLLLIPRTIAIGALLSAGSMLGAIGAHLGPVGMAPINPETGEANGSLFYMAIVTLAASAVVLVMHREQLLRLLSKKTRATGG